MVEFEDDTMTDDQADAMALARAFQAASDDDIRTVMNAMSGQARSESDPLSFYIVPASWFVKAFPILMARSPDGILDNWKENIGRISNVELINVTGREVSSDDDEIVKPGAVSDVQKKRFELLHRKIVQNRQQSTMKHGLVHKKDFFFLGPSAWMLVKEKFDFDGYELSRPVVPTPNTRNTIAIQLRDEESEGYVSSLISIPLSGRFAYEKVISRLDSSNNSLSAIVPDDEDANDETPWEQDETKLENNMDTDQRNDEHSTNTNTVFAGRKRLASGLGNLGNTCFMNSSIQCLAHTGPLRRYFLSGEYARDLNRDNPLGTGGELATQFATLLLDMWGVSSKRRSVLGHASASQYSDSSPAAVFPRSFKYCLGKHAEQFVGYEQHDSQELATYLLDALHEDTNRVTKKPYIEIPEQAEDESDEIAANKAWKLHLQRENSKVIENFMGQVKSRLECCREGCNRVSTTFDPFMFLSVPIPGSSEKTLKVTFVPLDPDRRMRTLSLTLSKTATINVLLTKLNEELVNDGIIDRPIPLEDLCAADVWSNEVFGWYQDATEIDRIRDADKTFIYQLRPLSEVREESKSAVEEKSAESILGQTKRARKFNLDLETLTRLNNEEDWKTELEKYVQTPTLLLTIFNPKRGTVADLLQFLKKLETFIDLCHNEISDEETTCKKRTRDGNSSGEKNSDPDFPDMLEKLQGLHDRSDSSTSFKGVSSRHDVAILEFCSSKVRQYILNIVQGNKASQQDGVVIQVVMRRNRYHTNYTSFVKPLVLRIPSSMTVYSFRELLSRQMSRSLSKTRLSSPGKPVTSNSTFGTPELLAMRQVALAFDRKGAYGSKSSSSMGIKLGMVSRRTDGYEDGSPTSHLAVPTDDSENQLVADLVGQNGTIYVDWHDKLCSACFDEEEYEAEELSNGTEETSPGHALGEKQITVMDCIEKYCQKEQLDESEMWYCNKCKDHVRAWKQFHLYRTPPILIVHLKRFHFSASTHRRSKITSFIDFPLVGLDLTSLVSTYQQGEEPIYDCYAVSNHYGNLGGGHYTAYTQGDDGTWCHYDDSRVTSDVSPSEVVSEAAYVLYYKRRDVDVDEGPIIDNEAAPIVVDQTEIHREAGYEFSSNHSAQVDDADDDDNMAVDGDGSSRTGSSPISDLGSMEGNHEETKDGTVVCFDPNDIGFPLQ